MLIAAVKKWPIAAVLGAQQLRGQQYVNNILLRFLTATIFQHIAAVSSTKPQQYYHFISEKIQYIDVVSGQNRINITWYRKKKAFAN